MQKINTLLIRHGVMPTVVSEADKQKLALFLATADSDVPLGFEKFAAELIQDIREARAQLSAQAAGLLRHILATAEAVEAPLGSEPEKILLFNEKANSKKLVTAHLKMLGAIEQTQRGAAALSADIAARANTDTITRFAPYRMTEISLRHIALAESGKHAALTATYRALTYSGANLVETLRRLSLVLTDAANTFCERCSAIVKTTSDTVTAINKTRAEMTEYYKLLQSVLLQIHASAEAARHIQKEIDHVQIPDVL